jgi:hypothetical protein
LPNNLTTVEIEGKRNQYRFFSFFFSFLKIDLDTLTQIKQKQNKNKQKTQFKSKQEEIHAELNKRCLTKSPISRNQSISSFIDADKAKTKDFGDSGFRVIPRIFPGFL